MLSEVAPYKELHGTVHKGWTCVVDEYRDEIGTSPWYEAHHEDGRVKLLQWSTWFRWQPQHFKAFVEAGFPLMNGGPWRPADIEGMPEYGQFAIDGGGAHSVTSR